MNDMVLFLPLCLGASMLAFPTSQPFGSLEMQRSDLSVHSRGFPLCYDIWASSLPLLAPASILLIVTLLP